MVVEPVIGEDYWKLPNKSLMLETEISEKYPLHYFAWLNDYLALEELLLQKKYDIEALDPHGRTPLLLSIVLDHLESARVLLRHGANACVKGKDYWSATQEAISTGDPELLKLVLTHRDSHMLKNQAKLITSLLNNLKETPDFYMEIKWEFTSWLPLVSRMCPSDVCRVWKQGPNVRIDASLIGFSGTSSWIRGNLSYVFRVTQEGVLMDEVNHSDRTIYRHSIGSLLSNLASPTGAGASIDSLLRAPSDELIAKKLTQPIFTTYLETDKIEFTKSKSGIWGWRSDRTENVNGHDCTVCSAANVQIVTLRRTEHLTEDDLRALQESHSSESESRVSAMPGSTNPLTNLLSASEHEHTKTTTTIVNNEAASYNPSNISIEEYFSQDAHSKPKREIGRPKVMTAKLKTYKAHLYLCEEYPVSLKDQVLPIVELMAEYNPYFFKLQEFLTKQLPSGFPMKIDGCYSFYGSAPGLFILYEAFPGPLTDFREPKRNKVRTFGKRWAFGACETQAEENSPGHFGTIDEEEQLVQMAVQRSLQEYGGADHLTQRQYSLMKRGVIEARPGECVDPEEAMMQTAIEQSFKEGSGLSDMEQEYLKALEISRVEVEEEEQRRRQEADELERILKLSLVEK
nr:unnamed protein product [Spirometra erinaceieuropaei]